MKMAWLGPAVLALWLLGPGPAWAYEAGERTIRLLGEVLNSDKHPVHLVLEQTIELKELLTPEAYAKLAPEDRVRRSWTEYNERDGLYGERNTTTNGAGQVVRDIASFNKEGRWYSIDYLHQTYDELPLVEGMSPAFAETLVSWFGQRPTMGHNAKLGLDYDCLHKGEGEQLFFYYAKDGSAWQGMQEKNMPYVTVLEVSQVVEEGAYQLPPAGFQRVPNEVMRAVAQRLLLRQQLRASQGQGQGS